MLGATSVFVIALTFRTLDDAICPMFPVGTHFLWHLLNAVAIYYAARALLLYRSSAISSPQPGQ
jgi:hypothetical protein